MRLHNAGVEARLDDAGEVALLHLGVNMQRHGVWRQAVEMSTGIGLRTLQVLSRDNFRPLGITFTHDQPANLDVHRRVLGNAIEFSQEDNVMVCDSRDLDMPIPAADPVLNRGVRDRWTAVRASRRSRAAGAPDRGCCRQGALLVDRVAQHPAASMHAQPAPGGDGAELSPSSTRCAPNSPRYLASSKRRKYEVAELLGFASAGDFSRWFRGQFGKTPSEWTALHRTTGPA
jgi:hypothetical protein